MTNEVKILHDHHLEFRSAPKTLIDPRRLFGGNSDPWPASSRDALDAASSKSERLERVYPLRRGAEGDRRRSGAHPQATAVRP